MIKTIEQTYQKASQIVYNGVEAAKYALNPGNLTAGKVKALAGILIATSALSSIPVAEGGPWTYCACLVSCMGLAEAPPLMAICLAACTAVLPAPLP